MEYADPDDREVLFKRLKESGHVAAFETVLIANDGQEVDVLITASLQDGESRDI